MKMMMMKMMIERTLSCSREPRWTLLRAGGYLCSTIPRGELATVYESCCTAILDVTAGLHPSRLERALPTALGVPASSCPLQTFKRIAKRKVLVCKKDAFVVFFVVMLSFLCFLFFVFSEKCVLSTNIQIKKNKKCIASAVRYTLSTYPKDRASR